MLQLIASRARNAVSRDKYRFIDGELDLDLTYITDRIIAMGLPGKGVEKVWRNEIEDVARFFKKYHSGHFIIINLSGEVYDYSKFEYRVKDYGYPDHSALPLDHLFQIMSAMKYHLDEDPSNVVAVHCLAGRGRTGTVISAFLMHIGLFKTAKESLEYFAHTRSSKGEGVITPSQMRYVSYYEAIVNGKTPDPRGKEKKLFLDEITMEPCPVIPGTEERSIEGSWTPVVQVCTLAGMTPEECLYSSNTSFAPSFNTRDHTQSVINTAPTGCVVQGDIQIKMYHRAKNQMAFMRLVKDGDFKKVEKLALAQKSPLACLFRVSFHTSFVNEKTMTLELKKRDLDGMFSGPCHVKMIPDSFRVTIKFSPYKEASWATTTTQSPAPPQSSGGGGGSSSVQSQQPAYYGQEQPPSSSSVSAFPSVPFPSPPPSHLSSPTPPPPEPYPTLSFPGPPPATTTSTPPMTAAMMGGGGGGGGMGPYQPPGSMIYGAPQSLSGPLQQPNDGSSYPPPWLHPHQQLDAAGYPRPPPSQQQQQQQQQQPWAPLYFGGSLPNLFSSLPSTPTHTPVQPPATVPNLGSSLHTTPIYGQQPPATYTPGMPPPSSHGLPPPPPPPAAYDPFAPLHFPST